MGVFDCRCLESGLYIDARQQLVPLVSSKRPRKERSWDEFPVVLATMSWEALALPIAGEYNSYGTMEDPDQLDANMQAVEAFGSHITLRDGDASGYVLGEILEEIRGDVCAGKWNDHPVSFGLVEDGIYRAIVAAVAANGATAWRRFAQLGGRGDDPTRSRLREALLADPMDEATRKVYVDLLLERGDPHGVLLSLLPALDEQPFDALAALVLPHAATVYADTEHAAVWPALVDFVRFRAWGTTLTVTSGGEQFQGYAHSPELIDRARADYAGMSELLAAVNANEEAWRARLEE
jgi:hypothetical protein